ncbi:MAG: M4 family metallopeptidase [Dermatophilaceae bacterium]
MTGFLSCILPPDLLLKLAGEASEERRPAILRTLELDEAFRRRRMETAGHQVTRQEGAVVTAGGGVPRRSIYDQGNSTAYEPGVLVRDEGDAAVADASVNQAYDGFGLTYRLFWDLFHRSSIDDQGMPIRGLVHYGDAYDNAFWDGAGHMFFGDGDGNLLTDTTKGVDVIGHELTHGVTQNEANLVYSGQPGALNESISDVFGSLVKQYHLAQSVAQADWLIGADIVGPELVPALRSMRAPGTANRYDDQPSDMNHYVTTSADNGGVHANSGIPNHAFYVTATTVGGNAWEAAGAIWYDALIDPQVRPDCSFSEFAAVTVHHAGSRYGADSAQAHAVRDGWEAVKVPLP